MNSPGLSVQQQFLAAVEAGDLLRIRYLLANGADANLPTSGADGGTPLIRAVAAGQLSVVQLLLEAGADPNLAQKGSKFFTPLMFACEKPAIVRELIAAGANVNARTPRPRWRRPTRFPSFPTPAKCTITTSSWPA